jgi:predicted nuclease with RNAse H fold
LRIIGIDCATDAKNVGLALCAALEGRPRIAELLVGESWPAIDEQIARWATGATLLALDAPLGWPAPLAESLHTHHAGAELTPTANALFRRTTDNVIAEHLGKRPLDVGSDRIARTAHGALSLLARLRESLAGPISLAWDPGPVEGVAAIEVYPAGTLAARKLPHSGYKGSTDRSSALRNKIAAAIREELSMDENTAKLMAQSDHALDATLCVCAGLDFLAGDVIRPKDLSLARREGWIWVRGTRTN